MSKNYIVTIIYDSGIKHYTFYKYENAKVSYDNAINSYAVKGAILAQITVTEIITLEYGKGLA